MPWTKIHCPPPVGKRQSWQLKERDDRQISSLFPLFDSLPSPSEIAAFPASSSTKTRFPIQRIVASSLKISSCSDFWRPMMFIAFCNRNSKMSPELQVEIHLLKYLESRWHRQCLLHRDNYSGWYTSSFQDLEDQRTLSLQTVNTLIPTPILYDLPWYSGRAPFVSW